MKTKAFLPLLAVLLALAWFVQVFPAMASTPGSTEAAPDEKAESKDPMSAKTFEGLHIRSIGPALTSGRVIGFAVDPANRAHYYVAAASGGVWKTMNAGTTWTPVFDKEGSYSIGAIALDPKNPAIVWVGTGEGNSQRSVGYGDGVYRSDDAGKNWSNVGLKHSEHIGRIVIDPKHPDTVYVAAQGPLWSEGGDRGLFKTTDAGKTWKCVLSISKNTGVTDVAMDPRDSDTLYAAAYQRRRHVWTLIGGGPESALYKSTDAGATWTKLKSGLPEEQLGRIGIGVSSSDPDIVYATVEAANKKGGIFRSEDGGATWERRNEFDQGAMYYGQVIVDPGNPDRIYVMNVNLMVSDDGGKTLRLLGEKDKHVDNHAMWIDPADPKYYLVGCDGGVYESFDRGQNWAFKANLPITQFYDVAVDNAAPFYNVYGGTQDNFSLGGPSRTRTATGIANSDWFVTQGGDGFRSAVDPEDPDTVYAELQYGELIRFDRRTGERVNIKPKEAQGEPPLRWNWDSPLMISPHSHTRLYFGANRVFQSDDRGNSWRPISGDLTRQIDRNALPVMGRIWPPDAVAKSQSTSLYGNTTTLSESPVKQGLIYAGTDDGLVQVTQDDGNTWSRASNFPGVPDKTYVTRLVASSHDQTTVYAAFDNHKNGDFAPYILRSSDAGKTWVSIKGNLPQNGPVLALAEDPLDASLLFVGTEFGLFFTLDGGQKWTQLKGGLPTISVHDLVIQKRENDLVIGTFGRGIYVFDDINPLRTIKPGSLDQGSVLFPVRDALMYIESRPYGLRGKGFQGETFFTAENPPFGATFTYYLKEGLKTRREVRQEAEKEADKAAQKALAKVEARPAPPPYPKDDQLRAEAEEHPPEIVVTVTDSTGRLIRRVTGPVTAGMHRVSWDLRHPPGYLRPQRADEDPDNPFREGVSGPLVMPGKYNVALSEIVDGRSTQLAGLESFVVKVEGAESMTEADRAALEEFQRRASNLQRAVYASLQVANEIKTRVGLIHKALDQTPTSTSQLMDQLAQVERADEDALTSLRGDEVMRGYNENTPESLLEQIDDVVGSERFSIQRPTRTQLDEYQKAAVEFAKTLGALHKLVDEDVPRLDKALEAAGAPWVPGHLPVWQDQ